MTVLRVLSFKGLGLFAAFVNVVVSAVVLDDASAYFYLTALSFVQLAMVFSGFGVAQKLVTLSHDQAYLQRSWPWFAAYIALAALALAGLAATNDSPQRMTLLPLLIGLLALVCLAEWLRAAAARQTGFVAYNLVLLMLAVWAAAAGGFSIWMSALPAAAIVWLLLRDMAGLLTGDHPIRPDLSGLLRTLRVSSINQFYTVIVVMMPLLGVGPEVLALVLVYRFTIFYNWPSFFWIRFGHKRLSDGITPAHKRENTRFVRINVAAFSGTVLAAGLLYVTGWIDHLPGNAFGPEFLFLLVIFASVRTVINLMFPFELFLLYTTDAKRDLWFLALALVSFAAIAVVMTQSTNAVAFLIIAETIWLLWRVISWRVMSNG